MNECPWCGAPLVEKTNKNTGKPFIGCSNYYKTGCKYTENFLYGLDELDSAIGGAIGCYDEDAIESVLMKFEED